MINQKLFEQFYNSFNARKIDDVLNFFDPLGDWPNGCEGGYVKGHTAVRDYWTRQWEQIDPIVTPLQITELADSNVKILVRQLVKDKRGDLLADSQVVHLYKFEGGLIKKMIIESAE